jgi:hypothetical protein
MSDELPPFLSASPRKTFYLAEEKTERIDSSPMAKFEDISRFDEIVLGRRFFETIYMTKETSVSMENGACTFGDASV